ncbi:TPA: hypothetical protein U1237_000983 [Streptococcus suis]|nr:hypothetical protein [Streptococcus suis]HEL2096502.1 hypothetical protein [Streptococcus suis]HEM5060014.1 hypothetical protein [Streptococcus suis]HEM5064103.1 hypothetical protein [Streptococcus suis]
MLKFFQDESFHDLKIKQKEGELNFETLDASPYFINIFLGFSEQTYQVIEESYLKWEEDNKKFLGIGNGAEFKGESIKAKNYKFGMASMDLRYINFYNYLFNLLINYDMVLQISTTNKLELLIVNIFKHNISDIEKSYGLVELKKFLYSFIKILDRHRTTELVKLLFSPETDNAIVLTEIQSIFNNILKEEKDVPHLMLEVETAKQLKLILETFSSSAITTFESYAWDYSWSFDGLRGLLNELHILDEEIVLFLDGKSWRTEGMFNVANERFCFAETLREESENHVGIRISDFLSNFIGRIMRNLDLDIRTASISSLTYIDEEWFNVREEGFECYKILGNILRKHQNIYWTTQVGIYFDIAILFYKFIDYFCDFSDYQTYRGISNKEHSEKLNVIVTHAISNRFN